MALECALNQLDEEFGVGLPPHRIMDESEVFQIPNELGLWMPVVCPLE
ncbi:hypothetical protein BFJ63_vAg11169 [Fusarium oxysporum f. sp. narcissi]|nr:hypothetical protein BFJ63_vAg11169 [Fusarium oxysporum f. sp. narcissi]